MNSMNSMIEKHFDEQFTNDECDICGESVVGECGNCDEHCICEEDED